MTRTQIHTAYENTQHTIVLHIKVDLFIWYEIDKFRHTLHLYTVIIVILFSISILHTLYNVCSNSKDGTVEECEQLILIT